MTMLKNLKIVVIVISFAFFCVQFRLALLNLLDPPMIDSSYERDITVDDMPIITICPMNQTKEEVFSQLKYYYKDNFFQRIVDFTQVSWGAHVNLTYTEVLRKLFDVNISSQIHAAGSNDERVEEQIVYLPIFGFCKEIYQYKSVADISIDLNYEFTTDYAVFITDRLYRSYFMPDLSSHVGSKIVLKRTESHYIKIKVTIKSFCTEKSFTNNDYNICINEELIRKFTRTAGCIPPMFASFNQCDATYLLAKFIRKDWNENIIEPLLDFDNNEIEKNCRQSCLSMIYYVNERGISQKNKYYAKIKIDQKVLVEEKVANYSLFQFIIDVGSSLGLWLGLSVLGLHDLAAMAVDIIMNSLLCRQMRNALKK